MKELHTGSDIRGSIARPPWYVRVSQELGSAGLELPVTWWVDQTFRQCLASPGHIHAEGFRIHSSSG